jgi:hypothetical protein
MTMQTNPRPEEVLPLMHPLSLLQQSVTEFWPTYLLLAWFVLVTVLGAVRHEETSSVDSPQPDWLYPVICCWGFQSVYSWLIGSTFGPALYFALDVLVALATLIVIIFTVGMTWAITARFGSNRITSLRSLGFAGIIIANALLIVSSLLFFYTPIS